MNRPVAVALTPTTQATRVVSRRSMSPRQFTRRNLLSSALVGSAVFALPPFFTSAAASQSDTTPGRWRTWLLTSSDELRPAEPAQPTPEELSELVELQGQRSASTLATIAKWDHPAVVLPWTHLALDLIRVHTPNPVRAARALALLHVGI